MRTEKKKKTRTIILVSVISVIILGSMGYIVYRNFIEKNFRERHFQGDSPGDNFGGRGDFQPLNETIRQEITSFFESSPSSSEIEDYCNKNQMYCMYYCREINPNHDICEKINDRQMPQEK